VPHSDRGRTLKLVLAYDGTWLVGWQRQADGDSVQGLLEDALGRFEGGPVTVHGAGRTDAGVHALGQVASARVSFRHDTATLVRALNAHLPEAVRVVSVDDVPEGFHARSNARSKTYRYCIRNTPVASPFERAFVWHVPEALALAPMQRAAALLVGQHDFAAFQSVGSEASGTIRTLTASTVSVHEGVIAYEVSGNGFLRHMVRAIVGTLVEVGRGWREAESMLSLLHAGRRADAGPTAPPHGLFLVRVDYD
jgi:tRNA pseudouridine38-40 synthase